MGAVAALDPSKSAEAARVGRTPSGRQVLENANKAITSARDVAAKYRSQIKEIPQQVAIGTIGGAGIAGIVDGAAAARGMAGPMGVPWSVILGAAALAYALTEDDPTMAAVAAGAMAPTAYAWGYRIMAPAPAPAT